MKWSSRSKIEAVRRENSQGFKILGSKVSASMAEDREAMEEELEPAKVDQLLAAVAKKDIVVVSGTVG